MHLLLHRGSCDTEAPSRLKRNHVAVHVWTLDVAPVRCVAHDAFAACLALVELIQAEGLFSDDELTRDICAQSGRLQHLVKLDKLLLLALVQENISVLFEDVQGNLLHGGKWSLF